MPSIRRLARMVCATMALLGVVLVAAPATHAAPATPHRPFGHVILNGYNSHATPALVSWANSIIVGWTSDDANHPLKLASSHDGFTFAQPFTLNAFALAHTGPALCVNNNKLFVVWITPDSHVNRYWQSQLTLRHPTDGDEP